MSLRELAARSLRKIAGPPRRTLSREHFENIYRQCSDPWNFETSDYEKTKYREMLATLSRLQYQHVLEIGCSIGVQTQLLAELCTLVTAIDTSEIALERARLRLGNYSNVSFGRMTVPGEYPDGAFDLTVLSEVGYYLTEPDLSLLASAIQAHSLPNAQLLLVHWVLQADDHPISGDRVHQIFLQRPEWSLVRSLRREQYRIDLLELRS